MTWIVRLKRHFSGETLSGLVLVYSAIAAMIIANSPLKGLYNLLIDLPLAVKVGDFAINKPLLLWVNDGLMAIFFFLVGLELKREWLYGELNSRSKRILPAVGALGGMAIPALIYLAFNYNNPIAVQGWAIPTATDIAFALAVLALLGPNSPLGLKVFLTSLAIFDDLGAIIVIAIFYSQNLSLLAMAIVGTCVVVLWLLNRYKLGTRATYLIVGAIMWVATLKSGVHATLAGVVLALFIPSDRADSSTDSMLTTIEHGLHPYVAYLILPIFAFCNSGLTLSGLGLDIFSHPITLGIVGGLIVGKPIGVVLTCLVALRMGIAKLPSGTSMSQFIGVAILTGIGFTMSLFIGSLAFEQVGSHNIVDERIGILIGSLMSGLIGYFWLRYSQTKQDCEK